MMDSWTRCIVCWWSVRILYKCMSVMPWQEVFAWHKMCRKMRKAGHEWEKKWGNWLVLQYEEFMLECEWQWVERTPAPVAVHEERCCFQWDSRNKGKNPERLVPCLRPQGMTEKAEFLWMSSDTSHTGALFFLSMKKTCGEQFCDFRALEAMAAEKLCSPLSTVPYTSSCNSCSFSTCMLYERGMCFP